MTKAQNALCNLLGLILLLFWTFLIYWATNSSFWESLGAALVVQAIGWILMTSEDSRDSTS